MSRSWIDAAFVIARIVSKRAGDATGQDVRLTINDGNELRSIASRVHCGIFRVRLTEQVRHANTRELRERTLAIKLREWRAGKQRHAVRVAREQVLGPGVEEVQRRSKQSLLRRNVL